MANLVRVGLIGAGANMRARHVPGLRAVPNVEIVGLVNRTRESSEKAAALLGVGRVYDSAEQLIADAGIDAVVIGTWPNTHCQYTTQALKAGKHVLCEARIAATLDEAKQMLAASKSNPKLVAHLVPSPYAYATSNRIRQLIDQQLIGPLREYVVIAGDDSFRDRTLTSHWRQQVEYSGINIMSLGILHETVSRWIDQPNRVYAQSQIFEPKFPAEKSTVFTKVSVPDSLQVLTQISAARGIYHMGTQLIGGPGKQIHLYGDIGTLKIIFHNDGTESIELSRVIDKEPRPLVIPNEFLRPWQVEANFVAAIRGETSVDCTTFETGVRDLAFTDAVQRSLKSGLPVDLG